MSETERGGRADERDEKFERYLRQGRCGMCGKPMSARALMENEGHCSECLRTGNFFRGPYRCVGA